MHQSLKSVEHETGRVYGELWEHYDDQLFKESVELFERRWRANDEPEGFFLDKHCLDVGCGGGRYSVAMALLGASSVAGVDVSPSGLADARRRVAALGLRQIAFRQASVLDLPFDDGEFDFVLCSGVLHHTVSADRGLRELYRVTRPGGSVYLLLYGAGGLYWPLNLLMRPYAGAIGQEAVEDCITAAGMPANKRRIILDSLFCPILETYTWQRVQYMLETAGVRCWRRWERGRLGHESDPQTLLGELEMYVGLWEAGAAAATDAEIADTERSLAEICRTTVHAARKLIDQYQRNVLSSEELHNAIIGEGHHRLIAERPASP